MDIGHDFVRELALVFQSIPVCDWPEKVDSLPVTSPTSDVATTYVAAMNANTSFEPLLEASYFLATHHLYGHMVHSYLVIAMELVQICYSDNLLSLKLRPFCKNFILGKFGAIRHIDSIITLEIRLL